MLTDDLQQLRRLEPTEAWLRTFIAGGGQVVEVGPFVALLDPAGTQPGNDYAAPREPMGDEVEVVQALGELCRVFAGHGHPPQLEFNEPLFPTLPPILERAGFVITEREPLMLCTPEAFAPIANPEVSVRFLGPDDAGAELAAFRRIFSDILGSGSWRPSPEAIDRFRAEIAVAGGRSHALATLDGVPVGTGYITSNEGTAELTRIATLPEARRRGVAATLTSFMLQDRFGRGDTLAWLTAQTDAAKTLYLKLGFHLAGDRLYWATR